MQTYIVKVSGSILNIPIKSGYHHIGIFESDQQFLGFSWVFDGVTKYFKFTVLPFGLSVGPYIFSKVMRPLVKYRKRSNKRPLSNKRLLSNKRPPYAVKLVLNAPL